MDYEKKYNEALEWARKVMQGKIGFVHDEVLEKFPELKESKDKKIRKELIELIGCMNDADPRKKDWIAWLEKQGEQKSIWHNEDEEPQRGSLILLIMQSGTPIVAKIIEPNHTFNHGERWAYIDDLLEKQGEQKPAESRQETKPNGGIVYEDFNEGDGSYKVNLAYLSKPQVELIENLVVSWQNHANNSVEWSEEDKDFMYDTLSNLTELKDRYGEGYGNVGKCIKWLKSIKDRVRPQPKQKWSEENEKEFEQLLNILHANGYESFDIWLKSLKQRYTWKPSEEQIEALEHFVRSVGESGYASPYDNNTKLLYSILSDLKKLKED